MRGSDRHRTGHGRGSAGRSGRCGTSRRWPGPDRHGCRPRRRHRSRPPVRPPLRRRPPRPDAGRHRQRSAPIPANAPHRRSGGSPRASGRLHGAGSLRRGGGAERPRPRRWRGSCWTDHRSRSGRQRRPDAGSGHGHRAETGSAGPRPGIGLPVEGPRRRSTGRPSPGPDTSPDWPPTKGCPRPPVASRRRDGSCSGSAPRPAARPRPRCR